MRRRHGGFTLIEIVVVLAIVAVLVAAAVPLYVNATRRSYKAEAYAALQELKVAEWHYYLENETFAPLGALNYTPPASGFWTYTVSQHNKKKATLKATGVKKTPVAKESVSLIVNSDGSVTTSATF